MTKLHFNRNSKKKEFIRRNQLRQILNMAVIHQGDYQMYSEYTLRV